MRERERDGGGRQRQRINIYCEKCCPLLDVWRRPGLRVVHDGGFLLVL